MFFNVFSVEFSGLMPVGSKEEKYLLIAFEHLIEWPIARVISRNNSDEVIDFVKDKIAYTFGSPRAIILDNARCFMACTI